MANSIIHPVADVPNDYWTILERKGRFIPKAGGRPLMKQDGQSASVAWFSTLEDATQAVHDLIKWMQS